MNKRTVLLGILIFIMALSISVTAFAKGRNDDSAEVVAAVEEELKNKTLQSGTLDVFDKDTQKVRNLRKIKINDDVKKKRKKYFVSVEYRDINTGDIVELEIVVVKKRSGVEVADIEIKNVQKLAQTEESREKEYSDQEIQDFMHEYLDKQTQFSDGKVMLFDKDTEKMRGLVLKEIKKEVRRLGIFYHSTAKFEDADTGAILMVDISVQKKKGKLKVQALRIRKVFKAPKSS